MKSTKSLLFSILKFFIGWPLSALALFFLFKIVSVNKNALQLFDYNIHILSLTIGTFFLFAFYFLRSLLWHLLLKEQGYKIEYKDSSYYWGFSELKRFVPGNIWSFLGRGVSFTKLGVTKKHLTLSILYEVELFILACVVISTLALSFIPTFKQYTQYSGTLSVFIILMIFLSASIYCVSSLLPFKKGSLLFFLRKNLLPQYSTKTNLNLLLISSFSVLSFGLGTYFTVNSLYYLTPANFWQFVSYFVFSLLIGYLSLITPMGIGVREGVIVLGLTPIIGASQAVLASFFARIVLLLSEMIFLFFVFVWKHLNFKIVNRFESFICEKKHEVILCLMTIAYIFYFTTASFFRYDNFYTGRFDLGNMVQTVWNTTQGRLFTLTDPNGAETVSRLAFHADFILVLISPIYLLWPDPKMLLLLQTLVIALGGLFVYFIAKHVLNNKNLSLVFSLVFFLNPSVQYANLYDFHPVTLATTFLLGAFYFLIKKRYFPFIIFSIASGLTKEQVWATISLFGVYAAFIDKKRFFGISVMLLSLVVFFYLIWQAIPNTRGGQHFAVAYFSEFGDSPTKIVTNMLTSPVKTLGFALQEEQRFYLHQLFSALGYLPIFSYSLIFALPDLLINLLSNNANLHQIYYQYTATITPFLFIGGIYAIRKVQTLLPIISSNIYIFYILFWVFYSAYSFGPLPGAKNPNLDMFIKPLANKLLINTVIERIPKESKVAATNNLGSHLSDREYIYTVPSGIDRADTVLLLLNDPTSWPSSLNMKEFSVKLKQNEKFELVLEEGDFLLFRKK